MTAAWKETFWHVPAFLFAITASMQHLCLMIYIDVLTCYGCVYNLLHENQETVSPGFIVLFDK